MGCRQLLHLLDHRGIRVMVNRPDPQGDKDHRKHRECRVAHGLARVSDKDLRRNPVFGDTVAIRAGALHHTHHLVTLRDDKSDVHLDPRADTILAAR